MSGKTRKSALTEGIIAGVLFGTAAVFIRLIDINPLSIALWRVIIASIVLGFVVFGFKRRVRIDLIRKNLKHFLVLGTLLGIHFILFVSAVKDTTILNATVLVNTTPIFSIIISTFLYRIKPSKLALAGIAISFIGAGLIAYGDAEKGRPANVIGDLEAAFAAVVEGFYLNYGGMKRKDFPLLPTMLFIYLAAGLVVGATTMFTTTAFHMPNNLGMLLLLIGLGLLPTATAHSLYFSSLSTLKSFETATMALIEPIGATLLGVALFSEVPTPIFVVGAMLVLVGVFSTATGK